MKYVKTLTLITFTSLLTATAAPSTNLLSSTKSDIGLWAFSFSGKGNSTLNNTHTNNNSTVGVEFQIGYNTKLILPTEVGVRQSIGYSNSKVESWNLSTKVYSDWNVIRVGNLETDAGANFGVSYGSQVGDWSISPEIIGRLYLKKDVDLFCRIEYPYDLTYGSFQNNLAYNFGLRLRF